MTGPAGGDHNIELWQRPEDRKTRAARAEIKLRWPTTKTQYIGNISKRKPLVTAARHKVLARQAPDEETRRRQTLSSKMLLATKATCRFATKATTEISPARWAVGARMPHTAQPLPADQ